VKAKCGVNFAWRLIITLTSGPGTASHTLGIRHGLARANAPERAGPPPVQPPERVARVKVEVECDPSRVREVPGGVRWLPGGDALGLRDSYPSGMNFARRA